MAQPSEAVFLDASSSEPLLPEARQAWLAAVDAGWGDPLRLHRPGRLAAQALDQARAAVAEVVGARADEVVFTPSGTQSSHAAVAGLALGRARIGTQIVTSAVEHSSTLAASRTYGDAQPLGVDRLGRVDLEDWRRGLAAQGVAAACLQVGNHEVGTLQPYREVAELCQQSGVPLVLDATSALGRMDLSHAGPWSVLTAAAGAFGGPPSVGFMIIRGRTRWRAPYPTDDYQGGRWPGPLDVAAIFASAVALQAWSQHRDEIAARQHQLVDRLRTGLAAAVPDLDLAGDPVHRLPHLLTFSALYVDGESLTLELDRAGFAVASGSACSSNSEVPSHVLAAIGSLTHGNVRIGVTRTTTADQVEAFLTALPPIVAELRSRLDL